MLSDIESGVVTCIEALEFYRGIEESKAVKIQKQWKGFVKNSIHVFIGDIGYKKIGQDVHEFSPEIIVSVFISNAKGEEGRRQTGYSIIEAIFLGLIGQKLNLDIKPILPKGSTPVLNVTDEELATDGIEAWEIRFSTSYQLRISDPAEAAAQVLSLALGLYLQDPVDDGVADAQAVIDLDKK